MKMIEFRIGTWSVDKLAQRIAGMLGLPTDVYPAGPGEGFMLGGSNDYWLFLNNEHPEPEFWELHARYPSSLEEPILGALLVLFEHRLHLKDVRRLV